MLSLWQERRAAHAHTSSYYSLSVSAPTDRDSHAIGAAVAAYDRHGAITWTGNGEAARTALIQRCKAGTLTDPTASRFALAYTDAELRRYAASVANWPALTCGPRPSAARRSSRYATGCSSPSRGWMPRPGYWTGKSLGQRLSSSGSDMDTKPWQFYFARVIKP